jgi:hypothetical protein
MHFYNLLKILKEAAIKFKVFPASILFLSSILLLIASRIQDFEEHFETLDSVLILIQSMTTETVDRT